MSDGWGGRRPIWRGDAYTNLHTPPEGTVWSRTPDGQVYPDCDCHRPPEVTEMRKREAAEQRLAEDRARRQGRPVQPVAAVDATEAPITAPEARQAAHSGTEAVMPPVDDDTGLRLMAKRLRLNAWLKRFDEGRK